MPKLEQATASTSTALEKSGTALTLGKGAGSELYIVQLSDPAVPSRSLATADGGRSIQKAEGARSYERGLVAEQADLRSSIERITGTTPKVRFSYTKAINGIAVRLTRKQAQRVARIDGVRSVQVDFTRQLATDRGPEWIGADTIWDGTEVPGGVGSEGEGVIVGVLDTGLNPANPSFADVGADGYDHTNPLGSGVYKGVCATDPTWGCNDKVIGYWNFSGTEKYDDDGHGSHTASTAAGNHVHATAYAAKGTEHEFTVEADIKGVAPHANIISYDVCDGAGCQGTSILAGIDQAITDGVDVINYSIGASSPGSPWSDGDAQGFLNARAAGINVATSAGNDGPGVATLGSPADSPWMTSVGATTHDRKYISSVTELTADGGATLPDIEGAGISGPTDQAYPLVYAGDAPYNNALCGAPDDAAPGTGMSFPDGTDLTGKIIVCDRGGNGRVEKGGNVADLGAEGMILANDEASGDSLNGDAHALPAAHITYDDGVALKQWMASVTGEKASLSGSVRDVRPENGDIMAAFSSRGPNRAVSMLSPSVSAPGVDILAAAGTDNEVDWEFISGTSMASPHTAGALALLHAVQPDWTPAQNQSALMTTAERNITDSDGTVADWHDMGSGRVELRNAARAGLVLDETFADYQAADPAAGGDVRTLNTASMADNDCLSTCEWTRTFDVTSTGAGTWAVSVESMSDDLTLTPDKTTFTAAEGDQVSVTVTADIAPGASTEDWMYGTLVLTPESGSTAPVAHLPVGVVPSNGVLPDAVDITTRRDAGSQVSKDLMSVDIDDLQINASGLVPASRKALSIVEDSTNLDPWDGNGVHVEHLNVPAGATRLIAKLENTTAPDFDMYVGRGDVAAENVQCQSATGGSAESCDIAEPEAGDWWVLVENWEASEAGGTDTADLVTAVVAGDEGNLSATGPSGPIAAREPFDLRVAWDEPDMEAGQTWYGSLTLGTGPDSASDIGVIPVQVHRVADDVTKTADVETAGPGDTITYTVEVQPNVSQEDLTYTITDDLPAGTTYVEGSATGGATYGNGVVSWKGTLPTAYGKPGSYDITTSAQDDSCVNPLTGAAGYLDMESELDIQTDDTISGDTDAWTVGSSFRYGHYGKQFSGVSFTDDGFLVYDGGANYGGEPWTNQTLPNPDLPNNLTALLWQDMEITYDEATNKGVSIASDGAGFYVVEYDDVHLFEDPANSYDMEVFIEPDSNNLVWAFDNINGPLDAVTIGTENVGGTTGQALVNNGDASSVISNGTVVCATFMPAVNTEPESFTYQVTVDDGVADGEQLTNAAVHTTSDPASKPARATSTVTVKGGVVEGPASSAVALSLNPDRFDIGGTTAATATVISAGDTAPTGDVQFLVGDRVAGTAAVGADGKAAATLTGFDTAGIFPVTAKYLGDATTGSSISAPVNVVVTGPGAPLPKVGSRIDIDGKKVVKKGKRAKLMITVASPKATPTGTVTVTIRSAGLKKKDRTITATLDAYGQVKVRTAKLRKLGKVKVKVVYSGDAATESSSKKFTFRVVKRHRHRR